MPSRGWVMTNYDRICREIAEALEPKPDLLPEDPRDDPRLWEWREYSVGSHKGKSGWYARDFAHDADAMLALIRAAVKHNENLMVELRFSAEEEICETALMSLGEGCGDVEERGEGVGERVVLAIAEVLGIRTEES